VARNESSIDIDFDAMAKQIIDKINKNVAKQQKIFARDVKKATAAWKTPLELELDDDNGSVTISTDDDRYKWVDEGTKPHEIRPVRAKVLRFTSGSGVRSEIARRKAKGARRDVGVTYATSVSHPGIRPRSITERVMASRRPRILSSVDDAIEEAIKS